MARGGIIQSGYRQIGGSAGSGSGTGGGVVGPGGVPVITPTSFTITDPTTTDELIGAINATNTPTSWTITAGNSSGYFAIYLQGDGSAHLRTSLSGPVPPDGTYSLTVSAANGSGTSAPVSVGVTVQPASGTGGGGVAPPPGAYPGQSGNPVGYAATPAAAPSVFTSRGGKVWPGAYTSLNAWPGGSGFQTLNGGGHATSGSGTPTDPWVFAFYDFDAGTGDIIFSLNNAIFVGCRFQCNDQNSGNGISGSTNLSFIYCSFVPRIAFYTSPPGAAWPSAGAGQNTFTQVTGVNCIDGTKGMQVGCGWGASGSDTNFLWDHCDSWGFGNSFSQGLNASNLTFQDCWIHDCCNASPNSYHQDGVGYVNGSTPPSNVTINHCTIASIGNTNGIAFQAASAPYINFTITNNYFSGFGFFLDAGHDIVGNQNWTVTDNVWGTDIQSVYGPIYNGASNFFQSNGKNNVWRRNTIKVIAGTTPSPGSNWFTSGDNGKFMWPDSTLNTTDWPN